MPRPRPVRTWQLCLAGGWLQPLSSPAPPATSRLPLLTPSAAARLPCLCRFPSADCRFLFALPTPNRACPAAELSWLCLGLFTALLYTCAALARSYSPNLLLVVYFQALPVLGVVLWRWRHETYLT